MAAHVDQERDDGECSQHDGDDSDWPCQPMNVITQEVAPQAIKRGPRNSPQGIEEQKGCPTHPVGSSQERCPDAQYRDKASEEDDLAAVLHEEVLPQFQFALAKVKSRPIPTQEAISPFAPDPEAQVIPQDRAAGSSDDHQRKRELVSRSSIDGGKEQHGLAREWNTSALDTNKGQHCPIAIRGQQECQLRC